MSYANPKPTSPVDKYIDFKGSEGKFIYYQKPEGEGTGQNIEIPLPIKFLVIDELATITGFNDEHKTGVYSNEVRNITKENLMVRLFPKKDNGQVKSFKDGVIGIYKDIKGDIKSLGGRYTKSIYGIMVENGKAELVNFKAAGSFLNALIESGINTDEQGILINDMITKTKGRNEYFQPIIEGFTPPDPMKARAVAQKCLKLLHDYFNAREAYYAEELAAKEDIQIETSPNLALPNPETDDDLPF